MLTEVTLLELLEILRCAVLHCTSDAPLKDFGDYLILINKSDVPQFLHTSCNTASTSAIDFVC